MHDRQMFDDGSDKARAGAWEADHAPIVTRFRKIAVKTLAVARLIKGNAATLIKVMQR